MKERNPVASLLKLRGIREKQARRELADAQHQESRAADGAQRAKDDYDNRPQSTDVLSPLQLRVLQLQGIGSMELLAEAVKAFGEARSYTAEMRAGWRETDADLKSAERLAERRREEAAYTARQAAQRGLDELILTMRSVRKWS